MRRIALVEITVFVLCIQFITVFRKYHPKFAKINRLMKLCKVFWAERRVIENNVKVKEWRNLEMPMKEKLEKKARDCFLKELHLPERGQEESQGEIWRVIVVNLGER